MPHPRTYVNVTVQPDGAVICSPDPVPVTKANSKLTFQLQTPGYAFPDENAIVVKHPGTEFPRPSRTVSATVATLMDCDRNAGSYSYDVHVVEQRSGRLIKGDPTIENQPE